MHINDHIAQLYSDNLDEHNAAAAAIEKECNGDLTKAAALITYLQVIDELKAQVSAVSKNNIDTAADYIENRYWNYEVSDHNNNPIKDLLNGNEPTQESFRTLALSILEDRPFLSVPIY